MSAIVAEVGQSSTGTQASDSTWARWTIDWSNSACWSGWAARYSQ
jgi:hypothetical protein